MAVTKESSGDKRLAAARRIAEEFARHLDVDVSVRLWDGSRIPLSPNVTSNLAIAFKSPGTLTSMARWPSLDRLIRHYAHGHIDVEGGSILELGERLGSNQTRKQLRKVNKLTGTSIFLCFPQFMAGFGGLKPAGSGFLECSAA